MTSKNTSKQATETLAPEVAPLAPEVADLLARIDTLRAETLEHPQVVNKTPEGVASRIARFLNKAAIPCSAHRFWTGAHVLVFEAKNRAK